jgi:hypothetical protein
MRPACPPAGSCRPGTPARVKGGRRPSRAMRATASTLEVGWGSRGSLLLGRQNRGWRWDSNPAPACFAVQGRSTECLVTCDSSIPAVTARARQGPAVPDAVRTQHGPGSRAWKARPAPPVSRHATPMAQRRASRDGPLLSVEDLGVPVLRARGGHGRRGRTRLGRCSDGRHLNRTVGSDLDAHLPRWRAPVGARRLMSPYGARDLGRAIPGEGRDSFPRGVRAWLEAL